MHLCMGEGGRLRHMTGPRSQSAEQLQIEPMSKGPVMFRFGAYSQYSANKKVFY